jgi:hypothetical protein
MYSTCLYCNRDMGHNDALETLPVGRRVAFDATQGRLWVICRACEKWNLVPFDSRLETIDSCERLFADARLRYATANIGIARLPEGLELVQIGPARRLEFAAWRYGDQFGRRRRNTVLKFGAGVAVGGALIGTRVVFRHVGLPLLGISGVGVSQILNYGIQAGSHFYRGLVVVARVEDGDGHLIGMTPKQVSASRLSENDDGELELNFAGHERVHMRVVGSWKPTYYTLGGAQLVPALGKLLPRMNASGGSRSNIETAVELINADQSIDSLVHLPAARKPRSLDERWFPKFASRRRRDVSRIIGGGGAVEVRTLPAPTLLALEMLAHEETERAALAGELKLLERQWKAADELAKIADQLAVSDDVHERFEKETGP